MNWPRSALRMAYEDMRAERDRLLTLVETLTARFYRLERVEAGLPEKEPQERVQQPQWDMELERAVQAYATQAGVQRQMAQRRLREGWSREAVLAELRPEDDGSGSL